MFSYFTLRSILIIKICKFLLFFFGHVEKRLDKKANVNFEIYGVISWERNNCNINTAEYLTTAVKQ